MFDLSDAIALALPLPSRQPALVQAVRDLRRRGGSVLVQLGVGYLSEQSDIPLRVLGHAACVGHALADVRGIVGRRASITIRIFSAAQKLRGLGMNLPADAATRSAVRLLAALAGSLRIAGVREPIEVDETAAFPEVPNDIARRVRLGISLIKWLYAAGRNAGNNIDPLAYAVEHAANSAFGDLLESEGLRVTIGALTEGRFWSVRQGVCAAAIERNHPIAVATGLILHGSRRPWYTATLQEPSLADLPALGIETVRRRLRSASGPAGNLGIQRECRATAQLVERPSVHEIAEVCSSAKRAVAFLCTNGFGIGPLLSQSLGRGAGTRESSV